MDGDLKGYITTGHYPDGGVGEVFLKMDRQGGAISGFCDAWSIAVSLLLQVGVSLEAICEKFRGSRFSPDGRTDTPGIRYTTSPIDYAVRYLHRRHVEGRSLTDEEPA